MRKIYFLLTLLTFNVSLWSQDAFTNSGKVKIHTGASVGFFGHIQNNDTLIDEGSLVSMAGMYGQTIGGNSVINFHNLSIQNSSNAGVSLNQTVKVNASLNMTLGILHTTSINILIVDSMAVAISTSDSSFVSGPLQKNGNTAFMFPLGKEEKYAPITISASSSANNQFIAEYINKSPNSLYNISNKDPSLDHISNCEYWLLSHPSGNSTVNVTLSWDTRSCGITDINDLRVAEWNGNQWMNQGNGGTIGTVNKGTLISSYTVSEFSAYTLASSSIENPLPISLLSFQVYCEDRANLFHWSTSSESNNDYFSLEHNINANDWQVIGIVKGAGNSNSLLNYSFNHISLSEQGNSYYRLKQTDFNGEFKYSEVIGISDCRENFYDGISVYPNPGKGIFKIIYNTNDSQSRVIEVFNSMGMLVFSLSGEQTIVDLSEHPNGFYYIHCNLGSKPFVKKIVKV